MDEKCSFEGCLEEPQYKCACEEPPFYVCHNHLGSHLTLDILADHNIKPIYGELTPEELSFMQLARSKLLEIKSKNISYIISTYSQKISKINQELEKQIGYFTSMIDKSLSMIENTIASRRIRKDKIDDYIANIVCATRYGEPEDILWDRLLFLRKEISFAQVYYPNIPFIQKNKINSIEYNQRFLYETTHEQRCLYKIDISLGSYQRMKFNIAQNETFSSRKALCRLNNNEYIYFGPNKIYRLSVSPKSICEYESDIYKVDYFMPVLANDDIYIFGDVLLNDLKTKSSLKYSLKYRLSEKIAQLPSSTTATSTILFLDTIILTGNLLDTVYSYDIENDNYSPLLQVPDKGFKLLLIDDNGDLYLLSDKKIYSAPDFNIRCWDLIGSYTEDLLPPFSRPQSYLGRVYFYASNCLYCFNSNPLTLQRIPLKLT